MLVLYRKQSVKHSICYKEAREIILSQVFEVCLERTGLNSERYRRYAVSA